MKRILLMSIIASFAFATNAMAATLPERLSGRILLAVEDKGQAWYVVPGENQRAFLGRPADAFRVMRGLGLGISEGDYAKFKDKAPVRLAGRIILRVASKGEAYYISPLDLKPRYLGRPDDCFALMRSLGLGVKSADLKQIGVKMGYEEKAYVVAPDTDNGSDDQDNVGELEVSVTTKISGLTISEISTSSAIAGWSFDMARKAEFAIQEKGENGWKVYEDLAYSSAVPGEYRFSLALPDLLPDTEYDYRVSVLPEAKEQQSQASGSFRTVENLVQPQLGPISRISTQSVIDSYPRIAQGANSSAIAFWDGYYVFSRFDATTLNLERRLNFSGNNPGDVAANGNYYGLAWEKSCRIYIDVINELNKTLAESKAIATRAGETCPSNIRLAASGDNFGLIWTATDAAGKNNLYLKIFDLKGLAINQEIVMAQDTDMAVKPAIVWDGQEYVVAWQAREASDKVAMTGRASKTGALVETSKLADSDFGTDVELFVQAPGKFSLFAASPQAKNVRYLSWSNGQPADVVTIAVDGVAAGDSLRVAKGGANWHIVWKDNDARWQYMRTDPNGKPDSLSAELLPKGEVAGGADTYLVNDVPAFVWSAEREGVKGVYQLAITN